jgi:anti-sigma factor RsiW
MQCEERTSAVNLFLDGALEPADQRELFSHLSVCEGCRSYVSTMMKIGRVRQTEKIPFPAEIDEAVLQRIPNERLPVKDSRRSLTDFVHFRGNAFRIPVPVACALIAAALVISFFLGRMNVTQQENMQAMQTAYDNRQPSAVIYVYGLPPVEVVAKATKAVYQQNNSIHN